MGVRPSKLFRFYNQKTNAFCTALHFHLSISAATDGSSGKPASAGSYEDAEFAYTPLLDEKNDRDLLDILPDYLTEEICFPRSSAAKFYAKVVDCMTKRVVVEEE